MIATMMTAIIVADSNNNNKAATQMCVFFPLHYKGKSVIAPLTTVVLN